MSGRYICSRNDSEVAVWYYLLIIINTPDVREKNDLCNTSDHRSLPFFMIGRSVVSVNLIIRAMLGGVFWQHS